MSRLRRTAVAATTVATLAAAALAGTAASASQVRNESNSLLRQGIVTTDNETPALYDDEEGGNSSGDDPAIWVHPTDSHKSIVVVTAKEGGLRVYDLDSHELQSLTATPAPGEGTADGRFNNVDIAHDVPLGGERVDVAAVSDRYNDQVRFYAIDPAGADADVPLREVTAPGLPWLFSDSRDEVDEAHTAYGLAVWQPAGGADYVVVTQEAATNIATVRIQEVAPGKLGYREVETLTMPGSFDLPDGSTWVPCEEPGIEPQLEGLAVDQDTAALYAAQEDVGVWRVPLPLGSGQPVLIDKVRDFGIEDVWDDESEECVEAGPDRGYGGSLLTADAEGLDIWYGPGGTGWVVVSSQGDSTFAVYQRQGRNLPVGSFRIDGVNGADDIDGSDGLTITNRPVGRFTEGLLVSHDEPETPDNDRDATNFSYVSLGDVARSLGLRVDTRASNDPRFG